MNGEIKGENEKGIGLTVTDNNSVEHRIEMDFEGEIAYHSQDGYPDDPSERTWEEDEHVSQARKYAKYYIYRNTEYDTLDGHANPDRIAATLMTLWETPEDQISDLFSSFSQQSRSHYEDVPRPVDLPAEIDDGQTVIYEQRLYLDAELEEMRGSVDTFTEHMADHTAAVLGEISTGNLFDQTVDAVIDTISQQAADHDVTFPSYEIDGTSELGFLYYSPDGTAHRVSGDDPYGQDSTADARMELPQLEPSVLDELKPLLVRHFVCQVRDLYITMGLEPPAPFRVLGPGKHAPTQGYRNGDFYPDYFDFGADIPGYQS